MTPSSICHNRAGIKPSSEKAIGASKMLPMNVAKAATIAAKRLKVSETETAIATGIFLGGTLVPEDEVPVVLPPVAGGVGGREVSSATQLLFTSRCMPLG